MQTNNQNKLLFYFLIVLSLFIIVFFAKDLYKSVLSNMDIVETKQIEADSQRKVATKLEEVKKNVWKNQQIKKYDKEVKEDELITYFNDWVHNNKTWSWYTIIDSMSFDQWTINEYGFKEGKINLFVTVSDEEEMIAMLNFIRSEESEYQFFIDNFSFPNDPNNKWAFQVNIPIRMFYK